MNPTRSIKLITLLAACALAGPRIAAQDAGPQRPPDDPPQPPREIRLLPKAVARPAVAYPLLPEVNAQTPGNAAQTYLTACILSAQVRAQSSAAAARTGGGVAAALPPGATDGASPRAEDDYDYVSRLLSLPAAEVPRDDARAVVDRYRLPLKFLADAARYDSCHWDVAAKPLGIDAGLPHLPELQFLANVLALDARLAALDGNFDPCVARVRTGMALTAHLTDQPSIVQSLTAANNADRMILAFDDLVASPGAAAPNLYWSLAALPRPMIDPSGVARWERSILEATAPGIERALTGELSPEQWAEVLRRLRDIGLPMETGFVAPRPDLPAWEGRFSAAVASARAYARAKRTLVGRPGYGGAEKVDALPIDFVIGVSQYIRYREWSDDVWKYFPLPYAESAAPLCKAYYAVQRARSEEDGGNPFLQLIPYVGARFQIAAVDRHVAAAMAAEALRDYAAAHDGRLPPALGGVDGLLPVPPDPVSGKPFDYKLEPGGRSATLFAPAAPAEFFGAHRARYDLSYHLTVAADGH